MPSRTAHRVTLARLANAASAAALAGACLVAGAALAQSGLRLHELGEPGLDPQFARGWLAPDFDRFGFARHHWKDGLGVASGQRMNWSYSLGERAKFGMSLREARGLAYEPRSLSVFGRYNLDSDWAVSAETMSTDTTGLLRLHDFRIGVQRRF